MIIINGLPEYEIVSVKTDWLLKELKLEVKLNRAQYDFIKSSCTIELPSSIISIPNGDTRLEVVTTNKLTKMVKLIVNKSSYVGEFVVGFTRLSYITDKDT